MSNSAFTPTVLTISSGTGSGSGEKNYITNPSMASATTGWNVVGDFTLTRTTAASELPREYTTGTGIKLVATSGTQSTADYMYFDFTLDDVDLNRKLKIQWSQKDVATYAAGQLAVIITSQADRTTALHTPVTTAIPAVDGDFVTSFDSGSTAALSLVIRATTDMTTGDGIVISDVIVGPGEIVQGAVVSDWQTYSSASTVLPAGLTTQYRRVGDVGEFRVVGATTGTSSSQFVIGLPTGLTFASSFGVNQPLPGNAEVEDSVSTGLVFHGIPVYASSTTFKIKVSDKTTNAYWANTTPVAFASNSGYRVMITATLSLAEWASSGTINLGPGAQVEYAASTTGTWDAAASATNTVYGPEGAPVSGTLSGNRTKTVRFQYPIQADDMLTLEVKLANGNWVDIANSVAVYANQNTAAYGARLLGVSGSTTDVDVSFQQYIAPGTGYGNTAGANSWSTAFVTAWRVRKAKASSPVGFGLVNANDSGLTRAYSTLTKIRLNTGNGWGSTNTRIRRFTNTVVNTGTGITYADSATLGASFSCTEAGIYSISYTDGFDVAGTLGISLNSTQLTTGVESITVADRLLLGIVTTGNFHISISITIALSVGDVIRPHTSSVAESPNPSRSQFTIQRIA